MRAYCMIHPFSLSSRGDVPMQLPPTDPDTLFEELLQDLPPETVPMAREFKAFARARKIQTPEQLLRVVLLYCGVDKPTVCLNVISLVASSCGYDSGHIEQRVVR